MYTAANVIYLYDGSFEGLLCCIYESVYAHETPIDIVPEDLAQPSLFLQRAILTDEARAARVYESIPLKICPAASKLVQAVFLSCADGKEMLILRFLQMGYREGAQVMHLLAHPDVQPLLAAELHLKNECHLLLGFLRFSDFDGALVAVITPKNYVLPYLQAHFCNRYMQEDFLIFDKTHAAALVYQQRTAKIISLDTLTLPPESAEEAQYKALWKRFYTTISIAARENPKCRMTHCAKRYWTNMLEMPESEYTLSEQTERHIAAFSDANAESNVQKIFQFAIKA
ncbi:MAG: TIGR03915 family putative DNA repair protein [Ruthenibacterium sp.]